ncbi:T9SS type A sorting domain-containing protein [Pseudoflavitalea sp. G-6-1-2]|uniref:T9SS type A sorting domain-containing protein n=1 Tax=Pseudoflavitalea sp. G-6-1-2 TaxID=2728841 RepID=UPI001469EF16|nr:T9SS type A sorting domain-containing protein [Pseudoflavitalea sp. G-6-1-2]NML19932.1 T9SS type A sorting domain-containing protein [Pseudoflavitalea sp. G-6-1-2]
MLKNLIFLFCVLCGGLSTAWAQADTTSEIQDQSDASSSQVTNLVATVKEKTRVLLNWRLPKNGNREFVSVERSAGGKDFEMVALLKQPETGDWYEWVDDSPAKGRNAYRIKHAGKTGVEQYSLIASTMVAGDISFKFYPNPVDNILIVRTEDPIDLQVLDGNGQLRLSQSRIQGLQTINVTSLEKGIYLLRCTNRVTGTVTQERLLKN